MDSKSYIYTSFASSAALVLEKASSSLVTIGCSHPQTAIVIGREVPNADSIIHDLLHITILGVEALRLISKLFLCSILTLGRRWLLFRNTRISW